MRQRTLKPKELVSKFFWQHYEKYEMRLHKIKMAELVGGGRGKQGGRGC
jgi:hypothetical protein